LLVELKLWQCLLLLELVFVGLLITLLGVIGVVNIYSNIHVSLVLVFLYVDFESLFMYMALCGKECLKSNEFMFTYGCAPHAIHNLCMDLCKHFPGVNQVLK